MKELIIWIEVDVKDELPDNGEYIVKLVDESLVEMSLKDKQWYFIYEDDTIYMTEKVTHWLKRVVIPILSDQEIEAISRKEIAPIEDNFDFSIMNAYYLGYKAKQEELINIK